MIKSIRALVNLALLSMAIAGPLCAEDRDPILTEKSNETFTVNMGGLPLSLPVELKSRAVVNVVSEQQTDLSIGGIDIAYEIKDEESGNVIPVRAWVDFQGGSISCDVAERLATVRGNFAKYNIKSRIEQITNENFAGYLVTAEHTSKGVMNGIFLEIYDQKISRCYTFNLAVEKWGDFTKAQVRMSLSPLVGAIKKSMTDYSKNGAAR